MKKIISAICALAVAAAMIPAAMAGGTVEIRFRVGDSVLSINGNNIEVETPYVVGEGTTLVPIRVISEAFGANVGWDGTTQKVTVENDGTTIVLQIGNKTAVVNGVNKELAEAPQLTANGYTMIPLRFISETLGATVGYDSAAQYITVSKATADNPVAVSVGNSTINKAELGIYVNAYISKGANADYAKIFAVEDVKAMLLAEELMNVMGLSFTDEEMSMQQLERDELVKYNLGGEDSYNEYLADTGITDAFVRRMIAADYATDKIFADDLSEEGLKRFYNDNYLHAKHILIDTIDTSTMTPYDDATIAQQKELAESLLTLALEGENFDMLVAQYSQDPGSISQPDGYYFTAGEMVSEFEDTTRSLGMNEIGMCESVYGYHIIKRLPLDDNAVELSELYNSAVKYAVENKLPHLAAQYNLNVSVNQAVIDSITN